MVIVEKGFRWAIIGVVGAMMVVGAAGAVLSAVAGLMGNPAIVLVVAVVFVGFGLLLVVPGVVGGLWLWRWWRMTAISERRALEFVSPDEAGRLPVPASLLRQPAGAQMALAQNVASFTSNLTHYHYAPESTQHVAGIGEGQPAAVAATPTGSFWQLYQAGRLPDNGFLMGYSLDEDGGEVTADWRKLYSALIGGQSGSGKSTLIRAILAQSALQGGRFVVIDPHYNSGDESLGASLQPLRHLMLCDVASEEKQIVDALGYVGALGQRRLQGVDTDRSPIVLVVDETTALLQRSNVASALTNVLGQIAQETRKAGLYALCIGQNFHSDVMPTTIRDCFVSFISCRARKRVAATMADDNEFGKMAAELTIGQAVWMTPAGDVHRLAVPNCTQSDLERVAGAILTGKTTASATHRALQVVDAPSSAPSSAPSATVLGTQNEGATSNSRSASEAASEAADMVRGQQVVDLFLAGESITKIVKEVYGASSGDRYTRAANEVNSILRSHMLSLKGR